LNFPNHHIDKLVRFVTAHIDNVVVPHLYGLIYRRVGRIAAGEPLAVLLIADQPRAQRLGRPVVVYCPSLLMYAPEINMVGETLAAYFAAIEASLGEPWLSLFDPAELSEMLYNKGFGVIEDLGLAEIADRFYGDLIQDIRTGPGPHVVRAQQVR